jgi:hypothetical protein
MGLGAGQIVYADDLSGLRPGLYYKGAQTIRNNTAALADDPDLSNIHLDPGYYSVLMVIYTTNATATAKLKTQWAFTGSWTSPLRALQGPGNTNTSTDPGAITPVNMSGAGANANAVYEYGASAAWPVIEERCDRVEILGAGNLSLQWAQNVATVANTIIQGGSYVKITKVDDL